MRKNKKYSAELKIAAVKSYLAGEGGLRIISKRYGISNHSILRDWILWYQKMTERHGRSVVFSYVFTCSMISKQSSVSAILNSLGLSFGLTLVLWRTR